MSKTEIWHYSRCHGVRKGPIMLLYEAFTCYLSKCAFDSKILSKKTTFGNFLYQSKYWHKPRLYLIRFCVFPTLVIVGRYIDLIISCVLDWHTHTKLVPAVLRGCYTQRNSDQPHFRCLLIIINIMFTDRQVWKTQVYLESFDTWFLKKKVFIKKIFIKKTQLLDWFQWLIF